MRFYISLPNKSMPVMISFFSFLILCNCAFLIVVRFLCALVVWENWQRTAPVAVRQELKHGPGAAGGEVILHLCAAAGSTSAS